MNQFSRRFIMAAAALGLTFAASACGAEKSAQGRSSIERPDDMAMGKVDAPVTLVEYASLTCPHCAVFHQGIFEQIKTNYIDTGKVRFIFRQFPTAPARLAVGGEAIARCKGDETSYYALLDLLFEKQQVWVRSPNPGQALRDIGATAGITPAQFDACVADQTNITRIQEVGKHAQDTWGIASTPQFVLNGELVKDAVTYEDFVALIDPLLAGESGK